MKYFKFIVIGIIVTLITGCATIFSSSKYSVLLDPPIEGVNVIVQNREGLIVYEGTTPTILKLDASSKYMKREKYSITFSKKGYYDYKYLLTAELDGWYFGNLLIGDLAGLFVFDPLSGAMYKIKDKIVTPIMVPIEDYAFQIYDINNLPDSIDRNDLIRIY